MNDCSDLELNLKFRETGSYSVEMRFSLPDSDADTRLGATDALSVNFDLEALRAETGLPSAYAARLTDHLFADQKFTEAFTKALDTSQSKTLHLRVRLVTDPASAEMLNLRMESLLHPVTRAPLFAGEQVYFSRYLLSRDWRPIQRRPKGELHALVAVANPPDLKSRYRLEAVKVEEEVTRIQASLCPPHGTHAIQATVLKTGGAGEVCTLQRLIDQLRQGNPNGQPFDILYLVAHGSYIRQQPYLLLDNEAGDKGILISGTELAARISELDNLPRLVVLASCESAGDTASEAYNALGPRLAEAGVPAVVAMMGAVPVPLVEKFMPRFFEEVNRHGQIDRAMAVARGAVRDDPSYWRPVLFMRLKTGRLWYEPGSLDGQHSFDQWPVLRVNINAGKCTPILGPGLLDRLCGSPRETAIQWAERYNYPMEPHERNQLPQVAQYLDVKQKQDGFICSQMISDLRARTQNRFSRLLPPHLKGPGITLDEVLSGVTTQWRDQQQFEPHHFLASLPLPVYITANFDSLLERALVEAGKDPQVIISPWNEDVADLETIFDREPGYAPTEQRPLVYHLFGRFDHDFSLVLKEDDFFDYLIGITQNKDKIPEMVREVLVNTSLLFVGFQLDDWDFRVLYRSIIRQQGASRRRRFAHVGVQIDPEGSEITEPDRARGYLEQYFNLANVSIFWGSAEDFLKELARELGRP